MTDGKVKVKVLNEHEIEYPDGSVVWRSKSPAAEPPDGKVWHPALGEFVDPDRLGAEFETEIDAD